tara:strand:+ start:1745 stop:2332 length:588 start_codon:yes stop_codon:yes gene_type:complete
MGILKSAADTVYAFRFIRMLVMPWTEWDAYKEGIIDENGKRNRNVKIDSLEKTSAYTPFIRLAANIKRLLNKVPGGGSKLGSFAAGLFLIKEKLGLEDHRLADICEKCDIDILDFLNENSEWFVLEDKQLSPGVYRVKNPKLLNKSLDELCHAKDQVRISDNCYPVGDVFGVDIYEVTHVNTNQNVYITINEIYK